MPCPSHPKAFEMFTGVAIYSADTLKLHSDCIFRSQTVKNRCQISEIKHAL